MSQPLMRIADDAPFVGTPTGPWLPLAEAARRLNRSVGHVARNCRTTWAHQGMARRVPNSSGQAAWEINQDADPQLMPVRSAERSIATFDWSAVPEPARSEAMLKMRLVEEWCAALTAPDNRGLKPKQITDLFVAAKLRDGTVKKLSRSSLWLWQKKLEHGPAGLIDARRVHDTQSDFAEFYALLENWYLRQGEPKMATCHKLACAEARRAGVAHPQNVRTSVRYLSRLSRGKVTHARLGPKAFDDRIAIYCIRDYSQIRMVEHGKAVVRDMFANDIWCADHHPCDAIVNFKGKLVRPWLTAWEDVRSRKIVGYRFSPTDPNSSTILLALRDAAIRCGHIVPRFAYTDNGKDYDAWFWDGRTKRERRLRLANDERQFKGVYGHLQIGHLHATAYNAKAKPIERWFRTYAEQFDVFQATYTGRNPQHKPEQLAARLANAAAVPTYEAYVAEATAYIEEVYHREVHTGRGMGGHSPNDVYNATLHAVNAVGLEQLNICLKRIERPITVGRHGVRLDYRTYGKDDPALRQHIGEKVYLAIDPDDLSVAEVYSLDWTPLCTVREDELAMWDVADDPTYRPLIKRMRRHNRQLAEVQKRGLRKVQSPTELLIEDTIARQRERAKTNPPPTPATPSIRPVRTGFEGVSIEPPPMRLAAGAEHQVISPALAGFLQDDD